MRKSVLSVLPSFIALIPWRFSRKTRVKTIPSRITIVRAPKYFGIGVVFVRVATAKTIAHCETTAVRRATPTPCCPGAVHAFGRSCLNVAAILVNLVLTFGGGNTVRRNGAEWQHDEGILSGVAAFAAQPRRLCQPWGASFQQRHRRRPSRR